MTKSTITREQLLEIIETDHVQCGEASYLARMALAAMDSESECLPLYYLQGHKDGLEWAAQLAEANHPETGDWLYDDPIELAKAIRKGPDMPPAQSVADSEPVIVVGDDGGDALSYRRLIQSFEPGTKLYRHAQPVPVVEREPIAWLNDAYLARGVVDGEAGSEDAGPGYIPVYREAGPQPAPVVPEKCPAEIRDLIASHSDALFNDDDAQEIWNACRAAMHQAGNCRENANSSTNNCREIPETSTNRSREHFISLCNEFWNWSEMDEVCAEDRGYELRMEWDGKVFKHPVTQALWRMYQAAPQEVK